MPKKSTKTKIRKAVIPVAGFGTRFLPATIAQPKEMLPIVDKPIIQYIVEEMVASGIEEIIFVTGRNKRAIEDHFDYSGELEQLLRDNDRLDLLKEVHQISRLAKFVYVRQNKMLGIGDALMCARGVVGDEPFAFANGDDIIDSRQPAIGQLMHAYRRYHSSIIGVLPVNPELVSRYGVVKPVTTVTGQTFRIKGIAEKPKIEEAPSKFGVFGRYIFTPSIFSAIEKAKPRTGKELYIADALDVVVRRERIYAYHMTGRYFDCGSKTEYVKANIYYALKHPELRQQIRAYLKKPR
ncbi:MAG: UTP--glucose-1-phosphate uridylyltransferase GalU [Candidatus Kerfeldbacteria bacterium]|nr:UTP--glucose-1-phosphate uridylyltransferase GalU [Candidatus Kerfeldbacteria bacterium]